MKILLLDIAWLAGVLEGEGSFIWHQTKRDKGRPRIQLTMTDKDIIERVAKLFKSNVCGPYGPYTTQKQVSYYTHCSQQRAAEWMMTIFPFMGERRQKQILPLLQQWRTL